MRGLPCSASFAELASFHFGENEVSALFLLASQSCRDAPGGSVGDGPLHPGKKGVTHDLASGAIYAGNPAKKIRDISKEDSIYLKKELW